uniref:Uncharacterized protein n=1 Tax=Aureoumbra lagunensis TaxID=44058 RepID=A0A7S3K0Y3_9STRA|mmetsp:Transcript_4909/g.6949  ORF Transcript_4909/g.6949 Transcript_4909/m.6949 type:complete len:301 (+) Transcript_4909:57-959(+)
MLVADYESDEYLDDDEEEKPRRIDQSKLYLETAKVLPPEILAALEGHDDLDDDDDDNDLYHAKRLVDSKEYNGLKATPIPAERNSLLAFLPAARNSDGTAVPQSKPTIHVKTSRQKPMDGQIDIDDGHEDEDETKVKGTYFTMPQRQRRITTNTAKKPPIQDMINASIPTYPTTGEISRQPSDFIAPSRKRRALEDALMAGEVDSLPVEEVLQVHAHVDNRTPEQLAAVSNYTSEIKVATPFYDPRTGSNITTYRPSKLQRRRHQINALAVTAAERELQLLERNNHSLKTKAQTHAKYGW